MRKQRKEWKLKWGIGLISANTIYFILSKVYHIGLCKNWDWIWVLSPIWLSILIMLGLLVGIFMAIGCIWLLVYGLEMILKRKRSQQLSETGKGNTYHISHFYPGKRF